MESCREIAWEKGRRKQHSFQQTEEKFQACARKVAFSNRQKKWLLATAGESGFRQVGRKSIVIIMEHYNMRKSDAVRYTMLENSSITLLSVTP